MVGFILSATPPPGWEEGLLRNIWASLIHADRWQDLLNGLLVTLQVSAGAVLIGVILGLLSALMRLSNIKPLNWLSTAYVSVFRGTPVLVQLMIWWFVIFVGTDVTRLWVAIIAFGVNSGAYLCEVFRGGIMSVDKGQTEAGRSLGLSSTQNMRLIILPQAIKNALPPLGNEFITMIKETSVVGFIGMVDLTRAADLIRANTADPFVPLISSAILYFTVISILTWLLSILERRLRKSDTR
ncbi:MAG: amino acid ABC transporter permease [Defluviitaleaceae bacterium]|nr:amino acid ABC transporter permease [Defluviitaleaceae bacterium]